VEVVYCYDLLYQVYPLFDKLSYFYFASMRNVMLTQIPGQRYWSPAGKVKGRPVFSLIDPYAAPPGTSCSVTFPIVFIPMAETDIPPLTRIRLAQSLLPEI